MLVSIIFIAVVIVGYLRFERTNMQEERQMKKVKRMQIIYVRVYIVDQIHIKIVVLTAVNILINQEKYEHQTTFELCATSKSRIKNQE